MNAKHLLLAAGVALASGCGALGVLKPTETTPPSFYALDRAPAASRVRAPDSAPTLIVNPPRAEAGFGSQRLIYVREAHKLEYFAHSEWIDPPARMLAPLIVAAVDDSAAFRAVVLTPSAAAGDMRLDTAIVRLQHEFDRKPSQARFTLRAHLVDDRSRRVIAWQEFEATAPSASEDPQGGVHAANLAVQDVLAQLAAFCAAHARNFTKEK